MGRDEPGPGLLFEKLGTKVIAVDCADRNRLGFFKENFKLFVADIVRGQIDVNQHVPGTLPVLAFVHFEIVNEMTVSGLFLSKFLNGSAGVFVSLLFQFKQAGAVLCFFFLNPTKRAIVDSYFVFHIAVCCGPGCPGPG